MNRESFIIKGLTDERVFLFVLAVFIFNLPFSEALKEIFLVLTFLLVLLRIVLDRSPDAIRVLTLGFPILLFSMVSLISALNSINRSQALHGFWGDFEALMAWVIFCGAFVFTSDRMKTLRFCLVALISGVAAGGAVGVYRMIFDNAPVLGMMNLGDKNSTAQFLSAVFLLFLAIGTIRSRVGVSLPFLISSLVLTAGLLVLCHSRSFLISVPVASFAILLLARKWKTLGIMGAAMGSTAFFLALNSGLRWEMTSVIHPARDESFTSRYLTWQGALRMFHVHPLLGIGPDTFQLKNIHRIYRLPDYASHGHNIFFNLLGEYGLLGVLSFLLLLVLWLAMVLRGKVTESNGLFLRALTVGFILNLLLAGLAHPMWGGSFSLIFMMVLALTLVMEESLHRASVPPLRGTALSHALSGLRNRFR
jgi:O-antigen ligase